MKINMMYRLLAAMLLLPAAILAQANGPALNIPNMLNGYGLGAYNSVSNQIARPIIGLDGSNIVRIDYGGLGARFGGNVTVDGTTTFTGGVTFAGLTATSITDSGLTSGRVTFASTGGLLADDSGLTYASATDILTAGGGVTITTGTLTMGTSQRINATTSLIHQIGGTTLYTDTAGGTAWVRTGGDLNLNLTTTTSGIASVTQFGISASTNVVAVLPGALLNLRNANTTNNNYNGIYNLNSSPGAENAGIVFINEDHATNQGSIAFLTKPGGTAMVRVLNIDAALGSLLPQTDNSATLGNATNRFASLTLGGTASASRFLATGVNQVFDSLGASTTARNLRLENTGGGMLTGVEGSTGGSLLTGSTAYATVFAGTNGTDPIEFGINDVLIARLTAAGVFSATGLAATTFSTSGGVAIIDTGTPTCVNDGCVVVPFSTDSSGKVTTTTTGASSIVITFNTATAFTRAPSCSVSNETTANISRPTSTTTTLTIAGTTVSGDSLAWQCQGF